jgi:MFS family permease
VIVGADLHAAAFALEATLQEVFFVAGPLLVGVLTGLVSSSAGVLGAALIGAVGITGFIWTPPVRSLRREVRTEHPHRLAALGPSLVRRIVLFTACYGLTFGAVEVAMPAFAEEHGGRSLGGICLAAWSAGSLAGGLLAAGHRPSDPRRRLRIVSAAFVALLLPLLAADSLPVMTVLMFAAGLPIAPSFALTYGMVQRSAAPGTRAEVFGWLTTAVVIGVAIGTAAGGVLITHTGFRASILLGIVGCVAATAVAALPYRDVQQA